MRTHRLIAAGATVALGLALTGCSSPTGPVVAPVVVNAEDIQGGIVTVALNQVVSINTGSLDVDSYTATIADKSIAEFVQGRDDGSAQFNPGLKPLKVGETEVTLANKDDGIEDVEFTLTVTE